MRLSNVAISKKIYGLLAIVFLLAIAATGILILSLERTTAQFSGYITADTVGMTEAMRIRGDLQNFGRQMNNVLLVTNPPAGLVPIEQSLNGLQAAIEHSKDIVNRTGQQAFATSLQELETSFPRAVNAAKKTIAIKRAVGPDQDQEARATWGGPDGRPLVVKIYDDIAQQADAKLADLAKLDAEANHRVKRVITIAVVLGAVGMICSGLLAFTLISRGVARPLARLSGAMGRLAKDDLDVEIAGTGRKDEVGRMAAAVEVLKINAIRAREMSREQEKARAGRASEDARVRAEAEASAAGEAASLVVGSIGALLEKLAEGDLRDTLEASLPPAYEKLRTDLNKAMLRLRELIGGITSNAQALRSGTAEIANAADDLSRRTEQQAASLEQTAAALDEITVTVRKSTEGAQQAHAVVSKTKVDAEQSGNVVRQAVIAMGEIEQSSNQIGQIIGVIDEIAFQTNLLALNAGVEAARAGDAGRGFAVVASEVRALAQRSAGAAKEIKAIVSSSGRQVSTGVKLVGETGQALTRIVSQVAEVSALVSEIAGSAQEQSTGLAQVNTAVNQMDQVTQQNAAMVEQSTAAARTLARDTKELAQLAARHQGARAAGGTLPATGCRNRGARDDRRCAPAAAGN